MLWQLVFDWLIKAEHISQLKKRDEKSLNLIATIRHEIYFYFLYIYFVSIHSFADL